MWLCFSIFRNQTWKEKLKQIQTNEDYSSPKTDFITKTQGFKNWSLAVVSPQLRPSRFLKLLQRHHNCNCGYQGFWIYITTAIAAIKIFGFSTTHNNCNCWSHHNCIVTAIAAKATTSRLLDSPQSHHNCSCSNISHIYLQFPAIARIKMKLRLQLQSHQ